MTDTTNAANSSPITAGDAGNSLVLEAMDTWFSQSDGITIPVPFELFHEIRAALLAALQPQGVVLTDARKSLESIDKALRGKVNDPESLPPLHAHSVVGQTTTYGLVTGLLRERDALLAKVAKFDQRIVDLGVLAMESAPSAPQQAGDGLTGWADADAIIGRLMSSDPDFDDCADAAQFIRRMYDEHMQGPDGYATWKEAAIAERVRRVNGKEDRVPYLPYLSDRADAVKGHYAIARWNPGGYREVWNLRCHEWNAFSDEVLTLEQATELLKRIEIPTKPAAAPRQPGEMGAGVPENWKELMSFYDADTTEAMVEAMEKHILQLQATVLKRGGYGSQTVETKVREG